MLLLSHRFNKFSSKTELGYIKYIIRNIENIADNWKTIFHINMSIDVLCL